MAQADDLTARTRQARRASRSSVARSCSSILRPDQGPRSDLISLTRSSRFMRVSSAGISVLESITEIVSEICGWSSCWRSMHACSTGGRPPCCFEASMPKPEIANEPTSCQSLVSARSPANRGGLSSGNSMPTSSARLRSRELPRRDSSHASSRSVVPGVSVDFLNRVCMVIA